MSDAADDDAPLNGWMRRVTMTHDGRPIGFTEPLSDDYPIHEGRLGPRFSAAQTRAYAQAIARGRRNATLASQRRAQLNATPNDKSN